MVTLRDAKEASDSIVRTLKPVSVVLFGSVARDRTGADLDLLIVTEDGEKLRQDANLLVHKCLKRFYRKFPIDPFIVPQSVLKEHYLKGSPFLEKISKEGKVLYMKNAVQEWLKQSSDELNMAEYLLGGGFYNGACYHAQQSIGKSIKARLLGKGWELEKTHSIERLSAIGKDYRIRFKLSDEEMVFIDSIYRGRYPAEAGLLPLGEPSKKDGERAVVIARRMMKEVRAALKNRA